MAPKDPNMAPKGSLRYFIFVVSANVKKFGGFRPFWVRKTSEIGHKMASIASYWAPKCTQFCPKWPQNDSQMTQPVPQSTTVHYLGAVRSFLHEKCLFNQENLTQNP